MKHAIYIIVIAFLAFLVVSYSNDVQVAQDKLYAVRVEKNTEIESLKKELNAIEDWRKDVFVDCNHKGRSNEPTYMDGACRFRVPIESSEVGQSVAIRCYNGKCSLPGEDPTQLIQKRIIKKSGDCIWVEGDNKPLSYDSTEFGWLCKGDYSIYGLFIGTAEKYTLELK